MTYTDTLTVLDPGTGAAVISQRFGSANYPLAPNATIPGGVDVGAGEPAMALVKVVTAAAGSATTTTVELQAVTTHLAVAASSAGTCTIAITTGVVTQTAHGYVTGTPVVFTGGAAATEMVRGVTYYVIKLTANTYNVAASLALALAGTAITASAASTGTVTATSYPTGETQQVTATDATALVETLTVADHRLSLGTPVQINLGAGTFGGVTTNVVYFAIPVTADTLALATTAANAINNVRVNLTSFTDTNGVIVLHAPARVIGTSGPLFIGQLSAGSVVTFPLFQHMDIGAGTGKTVAPSFGRTLWCRFVPSAATTAGGYKFEIAKGWHGGRTYYPSGLVIK
jgi:hypothetical protein